MRSSNQYLLQCSKVEVAHWSLWSSKKGYWWGKVFVWNRGLMVDLGKLILHAISQNFQYSGLKFFACPSPQPFQHPSAKSQSSIHSQCIMLWFKIFLGLNIIVFCFIMIRYHTQKQKKIKFEPRIKLNHNVYVTGQITFRLKFFNLGWFSISKLYPSPNWWARRQKKLRINLG